MGVASIWGFAGGDRRRTGAGRGSCQERPAGVTVVGLPGAVREAKERVRSAAASSGLPLPSRRITINLSPGDVPKEGRASIYRGARDAGRLRVCDRGVFRGVGAVGEVSLEGVVRPTRGVLSVAESASRVGVDLLIAPIECLPAVTEVSTMPVAGVRSLAEAVWAVERPPLPGQADRTGSPVAQGAASDSSDAGLRRTRPCRCGRTPAGQARPQRRRRGDTTS